jgi:prepilin-type N-terminal cleavage/methylation domain-containing protein
MYSSRTNIRELIMPQKFCGAGICATPSAKQDAVRSIGTIAGTEKGFSLMELLITIAIMAIVMSIATLSFNTWQTKSSIESLTHEMFTDISEARTKAFTQKKYYGIVFQPTSYVMKTYSSEVEFSNNSNAVANGVVVATKSLKRILTKKGADITDTPIIFDTSGFFTGVNNLTIFVNPTSAAAAVNCLVISSTRTNIGKVNGSDCEFK